MQNLSPALNVHGVTKSFGSVHALRGVSFSLERGKVLGLLGPNGSGKTTLVRILTTLLRADDGEVFIDGVNVAERPQDVRRRIGLAGQYAAVDENLTGRENLAMVGALYHISAKEVVARANELLERFSLTDAASRPIKTYSGGMRRRLDLAASLMGTPQILLLDEPTTGLDIQSRRALWEILRELVAQGMTLLLTTQYLEEADALADRIVVLDHGGVVAEGTPAELKRQVGGDILELHVEDHTRATEAAQLLLGVGLAPASFDHDLGSVLLQISHGSQAIVEAIRRLDSNGIALADLHVRRPTLDEVFLSLTSHA